MYAAYSVPHDISTVAYKSWNSVHKKHNVNHYQNKHKWYGLDIMTCINRNVHEKHDTVCAGRNR